MKKIVILGPESTGKSTLSQQLAEHYGTVYCPEFAREYLAGQPDYSYEDLLKIAMGQIDLEDRMVKQAKNGIYIIDTDMYVMKVWCEVAFEKCHNWILQQIARRSYDLHLLCNTDLPWVPDELREYPDPNERKRHYKMYEDALINSGGNWASVSGTFSERFQTAVQLIDRITLKQ